MTGQLNEENIAEIKEAFSLFDKNSDGVLTAEELVHAMRALGQNPTTAELQEIVNQVDANGNGTIEFQEFLSLMVRKMGSECNREEEDDFMKFFKSFDQYGDGLISTAELRYVLLQVKSIDEGEVEEMISSADIDGNGHINYEQFMRIIN